METVTGKSLSTLTCEYCGEFGNGYQGPVTATFDGEMHDECGANYRANMRRMNPEQWSRYETAKRDAMHNREVIALKVWLEEAEGKTMSK